MATRKQHLVVCTLFAGSEGAIARARLAQTAPLSDRVRGIFAASKAFARSFFRVSSPLFRVPLLYLCLCACLLCLAAGPVGAETVN